MGYLLGPKRAEHSQCAKERKVVSLRHSESTAEGKLNVSQQAQSMGISPPVGMEGSNVIFLILNAFSATLPVPVGFVHLRLVVSLEENQLLHNQSQ